MRRILLGAAFVLAYTYAFPFFHELRSANVAMVLYPLSAFRAMNAAALRVYEGVRKSGSQKGVVELMQSRDELYDYLGYHDYEKKLDELFARGKKKQ